MNKENILVFLCCLSIKIFIGIVSVLSCIFGYILEFIFNAPLRYFNLSYSIYFLNASVLDIFICAMLNDINYNLKYSDLMSLVDYASDKYKKDRHQRYYHPKEFLEYMKERIDNPGDPNEWEKSLNEYIESEV